MARSMLWSCYITLWDRLLNIPDSNEVDMVEFISEYIVKSWNIPNKY